MTTQWTEINKVIMGQKEATARELLEKIGFKMRVVYRDGQPLIGTADVQRNRINVTVEQGIVVTGVSVG